MKLQMIPKRWYSHDLSVMAESGPVADIGVNIWREKATLTIEGRQYSVSREGWVSGDFLLESGGTVLARAEKPSAFNRTLLIRHDGREYTLQAESAFRRDFVLLEGTREVGRLKPKSIFTLKAEVDLPDALPLPVRVFIIWLAAMLWMRESSGATTG